MRNSFLHVLHVVCRFIGYWARRHHFWGQNKSRIFSQKNARAHALLLRFLQNQKMHVIYIILSLHAKNQPPTTILKLCLNTV